MPKIRFIDLFSGIGGMRLGFEQAAHSLGLETECVLSSEINSDAQLVYQTNFNHTPLGDVRKIDQLPIHEILLAGFPCQSFSYAGKKAGFGDTRGTLFFEIMRLIDTNKPKAFIFENVRGLLTNDSGKTLETIKHGIKQRGYSFNIFLLNSSNFNLPQNRVRVYLVGVLDAIPKFNLVSDLGFKDSHAYNPQQLSLFHKNQPVTVADILEDDPDLKYDCSQKFVKVLKCFLKDDLQRLHGIRLIDYRGGNSLHSWELGLKRDCSQAEIELMNLFILKRRNKEFGSHQDGKFLTKEQIATFYQHSELAKILTSLVTKNYLKLTAEHKYKPVSGNFSFEVYKFLDPSKIAVTLVASDANRLGVYHHNRIRRITPREAARLQGFPDSFQLHPNDDKAYYQLGNSVSINVVKAVAQEVIRNSFEDLSLSKLAKLAYN